MFPNFTQGPQRRRRDAVTRCQRSRRQCLCRFWTRKARSKNVAWQPCRRFPLNWNRASKWFRSRMVLNAAVKVGVVSNLTGASNGSLRLEVPAGWRVEPNQIAVTLRDCGETRKILTSRVIPGDLKEEHTQIRAVLTVGGKNYSEGYTFVTREDLASAYYYQPAVQRVSIVDVKVPKNLTVAYIPGAGDEIPTVLQQIGIAVTVLPAEKLASENLSRYGTIVLGIRAYDTQKEVTANNKKLLDYVSAGGTLIVQYNAGAGDFNGGHFTPFPATLSRSRVSVEEAPVEILAPEDSVFHSPNTISQRDFEGWVQERGLYFMDQWDSNFQPLLSSHDPGEQPLKGGLLRAKYGKGTYIYTGYAFFRQLPAGVPGSNPAVCKSAGRGTRVRKTVVGRWPSVVGLSRSRS